MCGLEDDTKKKHKEKGYEGVYLVAFTQSEICIVTNLRLQICHSVPCSGINFFFSKPSITALGPKRPLVQNV